MLHRRPRTCRRSRRMWDRTYRAPGTLSGLLSSAPARRPVVWTCSRVSLTACAGRGTDASRGRGSGLVRLRGPAGERVDLVEGLQQRLGVDRVQVLVLGLVGLFDGVGESFLQLLEELHLVTEQLVDGLGRRPDAFDQLGSRDQGLGGHLADAQQLLALDEVVRAGVPVDEVTERPDVGRLAVLPVLLRPGVHRLHLVVPEVLHLLEVEMLDVGLLTGHGTSSCRSVPDGTRAGRTTWSPAGPGDLPCGPCRGTPPHDPHGGPQRARTLPQLSALLRSSREWLSWMLWTRSPLSPRSRAMFLVAWSHSAWTPRYICWSSPSQDMTSGFSSSSRLLRVVMICWVWPFSSSIAFRTVAYCTSMMPSAMTSPLGWPGVEAREAHGCRPLRRGPGAAGGLGQRSASKTPWLVLLLSTSVRSWFSFARRLAEVTFSWSASIILLIWMTTFCASAFQLRKSFSRAWPSSPPTPERAATSATLFWIFSTAARADSREETPPKPLAYSAFLPEPSAMSRSLRSGESPRTVAR